MNHDRYDTDILKTLKRIASALEKIEKKLPEQPVPEVEQKEDIPTGEDSEKNYQ